MIQLKVPDMSCSHCARSIERAVASVDAQSSVAVDLQQKVVRIDSDTVRAEQFQAAIVQAGFTVEPVAA